MKITIMYYYDLENITIYRTSKGVYVKSTQGKYALKEIKSEDEVNEIYNLLMDDRIKKNYHRIVLTKWNKATFYYNGLQYILLEISKDLSQEIDHRTYSLKLEDKKYLIDRTDWYFLWSKKIDYLEYQGEYTKKRFPIANEGLDYYIGMAETAISYLKYNTDIEIVKKEELIIAHKRITDEELHNPLNIVIDRKERNISEYLKYLFIKGQKNKENINIALSKLKTKEQFCRLYSRLIFPSYFFDMYEKIINNNENEVKIIDIIKKNDEYERYLNDIFCLINKKVNIRKIEWL